ncbi:MAG: SDR family NAD(P)-dependent oxidoreductase [Salinivirgaceae bacterium]|nr:SDR family NAD(P)-dependent oxidoreductase [Salinivirgaceae bacterium]
MKDIAIVTGASSGIGREFVKLLLGRKEVDEIWIIARNADRLQSMVAEFGDKLKPIPMDLSDIEQIKSLSSTLKIADANISFLINSAGFGKFGSYSDIGIDESVNMIDLNISGLVAMGLVCLPFMTRGARIINIASQASFQPLPYLNVYSATKAFVRNYSHALNVELKERRITVTAVCPGWMDTAFIDRGKTDATKTVSRFVNMTTPDVVAAKALRDAMRGKDISTYSLYVKFNRLVAKLLPQRIMMKIWLRQQNL